MVFATDFDPNGFDASEQSKQVRLVSTNSSVAQLSSQSSLGQASLDQSVEQETSAEDAIAAFKRDADYAERVDNVLPLHADPTADNKRNGKPATLSRKRNLPLWLSLLTRVQQGSTVVTGLLMTGALVLYGSTVYVDRATNSALVQLDALQGESQELTAANEAIKQSLAEQAVREDSGLTLHEADDVIFMEPAPLREPVAQPESAPQEKLVPLGY